MRKRNLLAISLFLLIVLFIGSFNLQAEERATKDKIGVVVTTLPLADFVENVGGDRVKVTVMVPPGASPHIYEPTSSQLRDVAKANIYFKVGSGVEFELVWMDKIIKTNPSMFVIDCSNSVTKIGKDPHIWNSPINAKKMVENICQGLIKVDSNHRKIYTENKEKFLGEIDAVDRYIRDRFENFNNRVFMVYHPAFGYFAKEYNLKQIAIEHRGKAPSPKVIKDCIDKAKQYNLSYVFVAPQFTTKHAETIAYQIGGKTLFVDPLPRHYISNMRSVAASLSLEME